MEARYVEAGSVNIFWTQNCAFKTTSLVLSCSTTAIIVEPRAPSTVYGLRFCTCIPEHQTFCLYLKDEMNPKRVQGSFSMNGFIVYGCMAPYV